MKPETSKKRSKLVDRQESQIDTDAVLYLLKFVQKKEDHNQDELDYISLVLIHVIKKLKKNYEDALHRITTDLEQGRDCSGCINLDRSGMIIGRELNVTENNRSRQNNRFISAQLQWLCVLLVKFFRFPEVTHHGQLKSTGSCQWNFGRKMENICCNVFHFELKTKTSLQNCNLSVSSIQPNQPSDQNHSSDPTLNYSNSNNLDNLNYREFQPSSSESMARNGGGGRSAITFHSPNTRLTPGGMRGDDGSESVVSLKLVEVSNDKRTRTPPIQLTEEMKQRFKDAKSVSLMKSNIVDNWATIQYYIQDQPKGKPFECIEERNSIIIDSGYHPRSSERFCLNSLGCSGSDDASAALRNSLNGGGLLLTKVAGMLFLDNNTDRSCFYQSWIGIDMVNDKMDTAYHRATVMEIPAKFIGIPLFDLAIFAHDLETAILRYREALSERDEGNIENIRSQLDRMSRRCIIRVGLEGYGEQFQFKNINETSGWLEIKMHKAMIWLDKVKQKFDQEYQTHKDGGRFAQRQKQFQDKQ